MKKPAAGATKRRVDIPQRWPQRLGMSPNHQKGGSKQAPVVA